MIEDLRNGFCEDLSHFVLNVMGNKGRLRALSR